MRGSKRLFKRKPWLFILLVALCITMQPAKINALGDNQDSGKSAEAVKQAATLSQTVERLYQHVLEGDTNLVHKDLQEVDSIFENSSLQKLTTVEGIHALSESIIEMKEAVARVQLDPKHWLTASAKLRMAADSINNPKQALWLQYYKLIREELTQMKSNTEKGDFLAAKQAYERLQEHYEIIRPAVVIQRKPADVTMVDSWLSYAGGLVNAVTPKTGEMQRSIEIGEEIFNGLFGKKKDYPALAPLEQVNGAWPWAMWAGAFILVILAYTAYRKYRGERDSFKKVTPKW
ncbi:sporulation protein YpjB [Paenibacillus sp. J23TS9]|uniref:sporulation protein YpjB n=1 Tax=Paenibacillus sp. J23TS9 TaxID=2807193 RepID=UPI001B1D3308|nr:sporulation protein YpjB [Paenibacillus sp. J23TS9]GIP25621.1 sporulation protein YpjB [Paenibacillus sp. J23TS9]